MMSFIQTTCAGVFYALLLLSPCASFGQSTNIPTKLLKEQGKDATVVRYSDFGAKGDGAVDDFAALAKAHAYANQNGLPVKADDGATYFIGGANRTIIIQTNTDFGTAKFIVDDTKLENVRG